MELDGLEIGEWTVDKTSKRIVGTECHLAINKITDLHLGELERSQARYGHLVVVVHHVEQCPEELHHSLFSHVGCYFQLTSQYGSHFLHGDISAFLLLIEHRIGHEPHQELGRD